MERWSTLAKLSWSRVAGLSKVPTCGLTPTSHAPSHATYSGLQSTVWLTDLFTECWWKNFHTPVGILSPRCAAVDQTVWPHGAHVCWDQAGWQEMEQEGPWSSPAQTLWSGLKHPCREGSFGLSEMKHLPKAKVLGTWQRGFQSRPVRLPQPHDLRRRNCLLKFSLKEVAELLFLLKNNIAYP